MLPDFTKVHARRLLAFSMIIPLLLISGPAWLAFRAERLLENSFHWVSHTSQVLHHVTLLRTALVEAETGQRGFLLTDRVTYLQPYRAGLLTVPREMGALRTLTADNPTQQENLRALQSLVETRLDLMEQTIALEERGEAEAALALVKTDRGWRAMESIRERLAAMEREESSLLIERENQLTARARASAGVLAGVVAVAAIFAVILGLLWRRLARVEGLVTVCAWSRTVEYEGEWLSFEEYLRRRFHLDTSHGISPAEAKKVLADRDGEEPNAKQ